MIDASEVAGRLLTVIADQNEQARPRLVPSRIALARIVEEAFWASLDVYEGEPLRARLYIGDAADLDRADFSAIVLADPRPMTAKDIRRLAPAHGRHGALIVSADDPTPRIRAIYISKRATGPEAPPWLCVECTATGCLRISSADVVLLELNRGQIQALGGSKLDDHAAARQIGEVLRGGSRRGGYPNLFAARQYLTIARRIETYGVGGAIWILPSKDEGAANLAGRGYAVSVDQTWRQPFDEAARQRSTLDALQGAGFSTEHLAAVERFATAWDRAVQEASTIAIANLSKVDGAILAAGFLDVLAFGVICNDFEQKPQRVRPWHDRRSPEPAEVPVESFGGSRHRSAINFCASHGPAAAVVASHDGGISVFTSTNRGQVQGARVSSIRTDYPVPGAKVS